LQIKKKLIFQTDDKRLFEGESPSVDKLWLNARVYQTPLGFYEVVMEYWDSNNGKSQEILFSNFENRESAIIAAKISLEEAISKKQ